MAEYCPSESANDSRESARRECTQDGVARVERCMLGVAGFRTDLSHAFVHARDLPDGVKSLARINFATFRQIFDLFFSL